MTATDRAHPAPGLLPLVELYTTGPSCSLCERTRADLEALVRRIAFRLRINSLAEGPPPEADYVFRVPVVHLNGVRVAEGRIDPAALESALRAATEGGASGG